MTIKKSHLHFITRRTRGTGIVVSANRRSSVFASEASATSSSTSWELFATVPGVSLMTLEFGSNLVAFFLSLRISSLLSWSTSEGWRHMNTAIWALADATGPEFTHSDAPLVRCLGCQYYVQCICYHPEESVKQPFSCSFMRKHWGKCQAVK